MGNNTQKYDAIVKVAATYREVHKLYHTNQRCKYRATGNSFKLALLNLKQLCETQQLIVPEQIGQRYYCGTVPIRATYSKQWRHKLNPVFIRRKHRGVWAAKTYL